MNRRMMMNKKNGFELLFMSLLVLVVVTMSTGCDQANNDTVKPVSIEERMNSFIADVNGENYDGIKTHTHPSALMYAQANEIFWSGYFDKTQQLSIVSISGTQVTVTGAAITFTFTMQEDGTNVWKIRTIVRSGATTPIFN